MVTKSIGTDRLPTEIHFLSNAKSSARETLNLFSAELRNDRAPLADGSGTDTQRPRDIRGALKVINNVLFEHGPSLTGLKLQTQPQLKSRALTSVDMEKFATLAERLTDAMSVAETSGSDLARACGVSAAAVSKWLDGTTKKLSADNYASAARALGVREEWLRTGRLPRDREHAEEERQVDQVVELLQELQGPLAALTAAIEKLSKSRPRTGKKRESA
jgi:transcriptional regulator with XRE-family HTH domain